MKDITVTVKLTSDQGDFRYYTIQKLRNTENITVFPAHDRIVQDTLHIEERGSNERIAKVVGSVLTELQVIDISKQSRTTLIIS